MWRQRLPDKHLLRVRTSHETVGTSDEALQTSDQGSGFNA